jgi:spore coat polysaccharide biosynthesis predicted glycosyltransferase SpsG
VKVSILTEGGKDIGFGHITRCTAIYQMFQEREIQPTFIINDDESACKQFGDSSISFDWQNDTERLFSYVEDADVVFIDSYLAGYNLYETISKMVKMAVYFDDEIRIPYPKGFVVNGAIFAERMPYPKRKEVIYLLGAQYAPLRKEFWDVPAKSLRNNIESVMITFGGADIRNITPKILKLLQDDYPELSVKVIVGAGFQNIVEIERHEGNNTKLIYNPNASEMRDIMFESDVAISAGGQTLYELARTGVPTIGICAADNQLQSIIGWQEVGFLKCARWYTDEDMEKGLVSFMKELSCVDVRARMSRAGRVLIDGKGTDRVVSSLGVG